MNLEARALSVTDAAAGCSYLLSLSMADTDVGSKIAFQDEESDVDSRGSLSDSPELICIGRYRYRGNPHVTSLISR